MVVKLFNAIELDNKWVSKIKRDADGIVERCKAVWSHVEIKKCLVVTTALLSKL